MTKCFTNTVIFVQIKVRFSYEKFLRDDSWVLFIRTNARLEKNKTKQNKTKQNNNNTNKNQNQHQACQPINQSWSTNMLMNFQIN